MRPNNLDLTRLLLAISVYFGHVWFLSHEPSLRFLGHFDGRFAVSGFFSLSGFLIFASYERAASLRDYFTKRAMRILPAYWLSTLVCATIAIAFSHSIHVGKFIFANLTFMNFMCLSIPGVFDHNPENAILNGSLWTIKIEIAFYVAVPCVVWLCRRLERDIVLVSVGILSILFRVLTVHQHEALSRQLPGQMCFFCLGALIYYHLKFFRRNGIWLTFLAALSFIGYSFTNSFVLYLLAVPVLVLGFGLLTPESRLVTGWGDFSYGTYVLHYPIVQTFVALGLFHRSPVAAFCICTLAVFSAAAFSWFVIERPSLRLAHKATSRPFSGKQLIAPGEPVLACAESSQLK